ncbi:FmdB family zinc ribbon protein [Patescibacteria group bacterium]
MPLYQFNCPSCKKQFEFEFKMAEIGHKKTNCPKCGKTLTRVYGFTSQAEKNQKSISSVPSCATGTCPFIKN